MASISTINGYTIDAGKFYGIDETKILANFNQTTTIVYTSTEDCIVCFVGNTDGANVIVNGITLFAISKNSIYTLPIKKDDTVRLPTNGNRIYATFYGLK